MRPKWPKIDPKQYSDPSLAGVLEQYRTDLQYLFNNGLLLADNANSTIVEVQCQHGVETAFVNPLKTEPRGIHVLDAFDASGNAMSVAGTPKLNRKRSDGFLGITVQYAPPYGRYCLARSTNQVGLVSGNNATILWDVQRVATGSALTHSTSTNTDRIVCNFSGLVQFVFTATWTTRVPALGDWTGSYVQKNGVISGADTRRGAMRIHSPNQTDQTTSTGIMAVTAGDYLQAGVVQANGAAVARDLQGNTTSECVADIFYVAPDPATTATVRLLIIGG